jgi:penicillin-binding protein
MGLEQVYEERLRGQPGGEIVIVGEDGQRVKQQIALQDAVDGETIQLTIDLTTQYALFRQMQTDAGAAAAVDPLSGEILALVSTPSFDPNLLQTYVPDAVQASWNEAVKPYFSSRFKQVYAPGSVFKLVTAAIGLNTGTLDPDEALEISGLKWRPDSSWGTYAVTRVKDPGQPVDLYDAFLYSDNIYFAQQALAIGDEAFVQGAQGFGIGEDLPVDYPFNTSQLANDGLANRVLLADTGYGQGEVLLSPLHLALFYSTLATEGNLMKPVLEYREGYEPEIWKEHAIAAEHVPLLTEALLAVVEDPSGTAYTKDGTKYRLLGKTGTAELKQSFDDRDAEENGWFVALNVDELRLAVAMMIEDVKTRGASHYVVPLVKKAMDEALSGR